MVVAGPDNDTHAAVNNTADVDALDVENAGLYILGGNLSTELVMDSENPEVARRWLFFSFLFFAIPLFSFSGSGFFFFFFLHQSALLQLATCFGE